MQCKVKHYVNSKTGKIFIALYINSYLIFKYFSDIDECLDSPCSQKCENFAGGYRCGCNEGFNVEDDGNCVGT